MADRAVFFLYDSGNCSGIGSQNFDENVEIILPYRSQGVQGLWQECAWLLPETVTCVARETAHWL